MYTNLPPGDYTFRVQAAVGGSAFSREAAARPFSIKPLFRETRLFYALCGLAVLAVALAGLRWRTSALRARAAELEQAIQERGAPPAVSHERASAIFANVPVAKQTADKAPGFAELTQKLPLERDTGAASVVSDEAEQPAAVETVAPAALAEPSESLPAEAEPVVEPVAEPAVEPVVTFDVRTVLIVDDNANLRTFFRSHLEPRFDVLEASDGEDALRVAHDRRLEMILTDSAMPMMDGFALCRALRHDPDLRHIPVILFADAPGPDSAEAAASGAVDVAADAYLPKPFQPSELLDCIDEVIKSRNRPATRSQTN
jgi:CheY-like chemotaxis protein